MSVSEKAVRPRHGTLLSRWSPRARKYPLTSFQPTPRRRTCRGKLWSVAVLSLTLVVINTRSNPSSNASRITSLGSGQQLVQVSGQPLCGGGSSEDHVSERCRGYDISGGGWGCGIGFVN